MRPRSERKRSVARRGVMIGLAASLAMATPAAAQLPVLSVRARAMGANYTALARGFSAVRWNPAGLGLADNPDFSLAFAPVRVATGVGPIGAPELADWDNRLVPADVKQDWLETITDAGGEYGSVGAEVTAVALSIGRFALQYGAVFAGEMNLAPDAAELLLFGNAGLTGEPRTFEFSGSSLLFTLTSTLAVSYAQPLPIRLGSAPDERLAVGVTVKRTMGHAVVYGRDASSQANADPVEIDIQFPVVHPDTTEGFPEFGSGWGVDVAAAWESGPFSAGVVLRNVVNTFEWDTSALVYTPASAVFTIDTAMSGFEERPISEAPPDLLAAIEDLGYPPEIAAGIGWTGRRLTLSADVRHRVDDGIEIASPTRIGLGAEFRPAPFLPLRAGGAWLSDGYLVSAGIGLETGAFNLGFSVGTRHSDIEDAAIFAVGLTFGSQ